MTFDELLEAVVRRSDDDGFIGSEAHLELMRSYVGERDEQMRLDWSADRTFYEPGVSLIALERPPEGMPPAQAGELIVLSLDHELAHARFTDQDSYRGFIGAAPQVVQDFSHVQWVMALWNYLEDARLVEEVRASEPDAARQLERLNALAVDEHVDGYRQRYGESPWVPAPARKGAQAEVALIEQILVGEKPTVHRDVDVLRERVQSDVDRARAGSTADVSDAAGAIYRIVVGALAA